MEIKNKNIHRVDRLTRVLVGEGVILATLLFAPTELKILGYFIAALVFLGAITGVSYLYTVLNINTREKFKEHKVLEGILIYMIFIVALIPFYQRGGLQDIERELVVATIVGFLAQMIDGSLGMAYGISSNTFLISAGIPPVVSSASVHTAEIATAGFSGLAHLRAGNVDKHILKYIIFPGIFGAFLGAYLLTNIPTTYIKPFIAVYLLVMGILIIEKSFERKPLIIRSFLWIKDKLRMDHDPKWGNKLFPFGALGGLLDSVGGGGWGPIITLTLFFKGENLRQAIGSVVVAEFFVTLTASIALLAALKLEHWQTIAGLIIGGILAAPLGPFITKKLPLKPLMLMVGILVSALSLRTIYLFYLSLL